MYLHNHRSGTNGTPLDRRFSNWALIARQAGYDPSLFGYTHTAMDPRGVPEDHPGLQSDEGILPGINPVIDMATHCPDWRQFLIEKGYELPEIDGATYGMKKTHQNNDSQFPTPAAFSADHSDTRFLVEKAKEYIADQKKQWAVHLSLRAPHPPWVAPSPFNEMYDPETMPVTVRQPDPETEKTLHPWLSSHLSSGRNQSHEDDLRHRHLQASYYGLMSEVDDNMGRLINWLKETGQWENTLFIFTSDHGEQMGDHWLYGKSGFFNQSYHIPLIIHGPGVKPQVREEFTEHVDIMPTILEFLGLPVPRQCDGASLVPILKEGKPENWRTEVHYEYDFRHSEYESTLGVEMESAILNVVRDNDYKYVHFVDMPELLFDLQKDPDELINIAGRHPQIVGQYARKLLSWRLRTTDKTLSHYQITKQNGLIKR